METNRLLIGCNMTIQMWCYTLHTGGGSNSTTTKVKFSINDDKNDDDELKWKKIWESK